MPDKHYVYSARTTEVGLKLLNQAKGKMSWDQFINDAVCAHYGLDRAMMTLPKTKVPAEPAKDEARQPPTEATTPEQPVEEKHPTKKKGKGKKASKLAPDGAKS